MSLDTNLQSAFTAVGTAVKGRISSTEKGQPNGVATLDGGGKIPSAQLPSYVDDVLEYASLADFPLEGSTGILYVAIDTHKQYRWGGTAYAQITSGAVDSVAGKTGIVTLVKDDVGLSNVDNTADNIKAVYSASKLSTARDISSSGDVSWSVSFDGSSTVTGSATLASTGVVAGTYRSVTTDAKGRVTAGTNPTTVAGYGLLDVYTKTEIGAVDTDYVLVFNAALV
jgi:phage-related tail fiber protein